MTIPSASKMKTSAKGLYGQQLGPAGEEYLDALLGAVATAWSEWQDTLEFGKTSVSGSGLAAAWLGTGKGGKMGGGDFPMKQFDFKGNSPQTKKFTQGLIDVLSVKFKAFPATYKIKALAFTGSCTATSNSPGAADGENTPITMALAGSGTNISGIASLWKSKLLLPPPDFDLANPQCKSGALVDAIAKTIEQEFQKTWLATAKLIGNKLTAAEATAGSGTVTEISTEMDGTVS